MPLSGAWRALQRDRGTIKRSTTTTSETGVSSFDWNQIVAEGVPASVQDSGGRMRQAEFGQDGARLVRIVMGTEVDIQQNDLFIRARDGMPYKITHVQIASGGSHKLVIGQQWVLGGQG